MYQSSAECEHTVQNLAIDSFCPTSYMIFCSFQQEPNPNCGRIGLPQNGILLCFFCICGPSFYRPKVWSISTQDYPSIAHIAETLSENNIQTIFAVTADVLHLYEVTWMKIIYSEHHLSKMLQFYNYMSKGGIQSSHLSVSTSTPVVRVA